MKKIIMKISKKVIVIAAIYGFTIIFLSCGKNPTNEKTNETATIAKKTEWLNDRPIVFVGNWDSAPILTRRWGGMSTDFLDTYTRMHTEETVKKMKEQGITLVIIHFYKGFGLVAEREYIEDAIKFTALCHQYGIKVGVYIGDTICYETFLKEVPGAIDWLVPDYLGAPVQYSATQTFRRRPYIGHPDYVNYLKKVVKVAIDEVKVDFIHFDNSCSQALPEDFQHPLAIEQFRDYLKNKYNLEQLKDRFGFSDVNYFTPPKYRGIPQPIIDPLFQEWTDFRCQKLSDHYSNMRTYIKSLNPNVVVEHNPHGVTGNNTAWEIGIDWPRAIASTEIFWSEGERDPGLSPDGVLVSKIRSYKVARTLDNMCFTVTGTSKLRMAEAMAYNQHCIGYMGGVLSVYNFSEAQSRYIKFFTDNFIYYRDNESVADVAILRTFPTMAYSNFSTQYSTILFEQTLIQENIPFDIIFENNLQNLSKYSVLVLANQECLSDKQIEMIRTFVHEGGGLVITENTSLYTEWMRKRPNPGLNDLFTDKIILSSGAGQVTVKNKYNLGRAAYIPAIIPSIVHPQNAAPTSEYWKLPVNYKDLVDAVKWADGKDLSLEIKSPDYVTTELTQSLDQSKLMLHIVNFKTEGEQLVKNIDISLRIPKGKQVKELILLSPDSEGSESLPFKVKDDRADFKVPRLEIYDLVVIKLQ
jgi:hypothetical protein